jgi:single-strand DNA-binding protein
MNQCCLIGRLLRPPSVRFEGDGQQVTTFTLAVQEPTRTGTPFTLYVPCTAWGRSAEACSLLSAQDLGAVQGTLTWRPRKRTCGQEPSDLVVRIREVAVRAPVAATVATTNEPKETLCDDHHVAAYHVCHAPRRGVLQRR